MAAGKSGSILEWRLSYAALGGIYIFVSNPLIHCSVIKPNKTLLWWSCTLLCFRDRGRRGLDATQVSQKEFKQQVLRKNNKGYEFIGIGKWGGSERILGRGSKYDKAILYEGLKESMKTLLFKFPHKTHDRGCDSFQWFFLWLSTVHGPFCSALASSLSSVLDVAIKIAPGYCR